MDDQDNEWQSLLDDVLKEKDTGKLAAKVNELEAAIFFRFQELETSSDGHVERTKLNAAAEKLFEIKIQKLGFPTSSLRSLGRGSIEQ